MLPPTSTTVVYMIQQVHSTTAVPGSIYRTIWHVGSKFITVRYCTSSAILSALRSPLTVRLLLRAVGAGGAGTKGPPRIDRLLQSKDQRVGATTGREGRQQCGAVEHGERVPYYTFGGSGDRLKIRYCNSCAIQTVVVLMST